MHRVMLIFCAEYSKLNRQVSALIKQNDGRVPKVYIKAVADLETAMLEAIEKQKVTPKKMNAINTRGLNAVRQAIRKNNKEYTKDIEAYKADEDEFMREDEVEEKKQTSKKAKKTVDDLAPTAVAEAGDDGFTIVGAGGRAVQYTPEGILKHLRSIVDQRGRKNADRLDHIRTLEKLFDVAINDYQRIRVLLTLISTRFDLTSGSGNQMAQEQWKL
jgi:translation initiation factor 3 subunit C